MAPPAHLSVHVHGNTSDSEGEDSLLSVDLDKESITLDWDNVRFGNPLAHMAWAKSLPPPSATGSSRLRGVQVEAIRSLTCGPDKLYADVTEKLQFWTRRKAELESVSASYRATLDSTLHGTLGRLDLFLLEEMLVRSKRKGADYVSDLAKGFPITGSIPAGQCGTPIPGGQSVHGRPGLGGPEPLEELRARCYEINQTTIRSAEGSQAAVIAI